MKKNTLKIIFFNIALAFVFLFISLCPHTVYAETVSFIGYTTSTYTGNLGYTKGANDKCHNEGGTFTGSRAMTYDDWLKLGTDYTYANNVWLIDGSDYVYEIKSIVGPTTYHHNIQITKDGSDFIKESSYAGLNNYFIACNGWIRSNANYLGPVLRTSGSLLLEGCNNTYRLACVR